MIAASARLARNERCSYAPEMPSRRFIFITCAASLAACEDAQKQAPKRPAGGAAKARTSVARVGRKTERAFLHVGGHLEKFFTGHDTISR